MIVLKQLRFHKLYENSVVPKVEYIVIVFDGKLKFQTLQDKW